MDTLEKADAPPAASARWLLSPAKAETLRKDYSDLDDSLSAKLSPASHKRHYQQNLADVLVQIGWPKMPPAADAAVAAIYLADDYIIGLADEDTVKQVKADIEQFAKDARIEITYAGNIQDQSLVRRARNLTSLIGDFVAKDMHASPDVIRDIRAIQNNIPPDVPKPPSPLSGPRPIPANTGPQSRLQLGGAR